MSDEKPYEVCDPVSPGVWVRVFGVWNAWAAVREVLKDKIYDAATFGPARIFTVRFKNSDGYSYSSIRVVVPPQRFEVQIGPRDGKGPWKTAPSVRAGAR